MALAVGIRLGAYEIRGSIGAGGMGEVYRARDTRLKESASAGVRALVMELVEGEDLAQRIARGPLPVEEALPVARQIAEALETAHEAGIVHRDLKPANVRVRPDGTVKVLDFGLAKALDRGGAAAAPALQVNSPTFTSPAITQMGVILGTAAYMAPEQAKGRTVDRRADIWAFGCVLYEMLAGRPAFDGETITDVLAAILTAEPDWSALPRPLPDRVRTLLGRCLIRDPRLRLRDIGEARIALGGAMETDRQVPGARPPLPPPWRAAAVLAAIAAAGGAGYFLADRPVLQSPGLLQTTFQQVTEQPGLERQPTISPDGRTVVYVSEARGRSDLYALRVGGRNAVLLTADSEHDNYAPAFSPDGNRIAFRSERDGGGIFVMEATGESVRRITDFGFDPRWSPDGSALTVADERVFDPMSRAMDSRVWVVRLADGEKRLVAEIDGVGPRWSPDGRRIVFWSVRRNRNSERDIFTVAADGSEARSPVPVTDDAAIDWSPAWSPDGRHIYFASSRGGTMNLWRVGIDAASGRPTAPPEPVTTPTTWSGHFDFAADGRSLVFNDLDERSVIFVAAFDPLSGRLAGAPRQVLQGRAINSLDVTRDGRALVFSQRGRTWEALGTIRTDGSGWSRITGDAQYHRLPTWSPDGARLLFYRNQGRSRLWTSRPDGSGLGEIPLPQEVTGGVYPVWSPDGARLAGAFEEGVFVFDLSSDPVRILVRFDPDIDFRPFSWSPDGRRIAGAARYAARDDVLVLDLEAHSRRVVASGGSSPAWLPDGRRLLFSGVTHLMRLDVETGAAEALMALPRLYDHWGRTVALSGDGRTLVYLQSQSEGDVWLMTLGDE